MYFFLLRHPGKTYPLFLRRQESPSPLIGAVEREIPACAGMTIKEAGRPIKQAGMTKEDRTVIARSVSDAAIQTQLCNGTKQGRNDGFSLVELSIVLVILGLLVGGIMTGQSLIKAAELRTITTDAEMYRTAIYQFQQKYFALPGDMPNAEDFWGEMAACPPPQEASPQTAASKETCDGNGNGKISSGQYGYTLESLTAWQHLANSGLINGQYTGVSAAGAANLSNSLAGENCPRSRYNNNACWGLLHLENGGVRTMSGCGGDHCGNYFPGKNGNVLVLGRLSSLRPVFPFISPEDMWNIDTKMDDGRPDQGVLSSGNHAAVQDCYIDVGGVLEYNLADSDEACMMVFRFDF